jgi:Spy/CpxP family protein refolding chaperone
MNKTQKILVAITVGSVLVVSTGASIASGYKHKYGKGCEHGYSMKEHGHGMKAVYKLDDLTDEQEDQLDAFRKEQRSLMFESRDAMQDSRRAMHEAMRDGADMEAVRKLAREQGNQVESMIIQRAEARQKLATILTEEQMAELESMKKRGRYYEEDDD